MKKIFSLTRIFILIFTLFTQNSVNIFINVWRDKYSKKITGLSHHGNLRNVQLQILSTLYILKGLRKFHLNKGLGNIYFSSIPALEIANN